MHKHLKHVKHLLLYFIIHAVVLLAVLLSIIRFSMPYIKDYLPKVEDLASQQLGVNIQVGKIETGWRRFEPVLRFEDVTILNVDTHQPVASAQYLDVSIDLFGSLRHLKYVPGRITFSGITLTFEQQSDGSFRLKNHSQDTSKSIDQTLSELLGRFPRVSIKEGELKFELKEGKLLNTHLNYLSFVPRRGNYHFEAELTGEHLVGKLKVVADIKGKLDALMQSEIDGYIHLSQAQFDERLMPWQFYAIKPESGQLTLDAWFKWQEGHWHELIGKVALENAQLQSTKHPNLILPFNLSADIAWQQLGGDFWRLSGDDIALKIGKNESPLATFMLEGGPREPWNFRMNKIAVDDILDVLALSDQINHQAREAIRHLNLQGELHDIQWIATSSHEGFKDWHVGILLDDLHWQAYEKIPAASHISGEVKLTEHQGQFTIDSKDVVVQLPTWYEFPLVFNKAQGVLNWHYDKQWTIQADKLALANDDLELDAMLSLIIPEDTDKATIDLTLTAGDADQVIAKKYLPTKLLNPATVQWINQSVEAGEILGMKTVVKGPLNRFPFKKSEGEFDMRFSLENVELRYHPAWPVLHKLQGELVIEGNGLQAYIDKGIYQDAVIVNSKVSLPFSRAPNPLMLHISGLVQTSTKDAQDFLRASPLWQKLGSTFELVDIQGPLSLDLKTDIPLRAGIGKLDVDGKVALTNGTIAIKKWNLHLDDVNGDLNFTENSITAKSINGAFLGQNGILSAKTVIKGNESEITWNYHSILNKPMIEYFARSNYWHYMDGYGEYDASFKVTIPKKEQPLAITISSNLQGISVNVPAPMGKTAEQNSPSALTLSFLPSDVLQANFHYGQQAWGSFYFAKTPTGYQLKRGQLSGGREPTTLPMPANGVLLTGHMPNLVVQEWINFFDNHEKLYPKKTGETSPLLVINDLQIDNLQYKDWQLSKAQVNVNRMPEFWMIDLNSEQMQGKLQLPHHWEKTPLVMDLSRCTWPLGDASPNKPAKLQPTDLHAVDFRCAQFNYKKSNIGMIQVKIEPQPGHNGVNFDPIIVQSETDTLSVAGSWIVQDGTQVSHFKGNLSSENMGNSLRAWSVPNDVQDAKGDGTFDLKWPGSPRDFAAKNLSGELDVKMEQGRFVGVNPGFGRILGLLSFQGLQRRLRLDFSDIFKEGFAFDTFKSNIIINNGVANTKNAAIKAPSADINISGSTNLATHSLDLDMHVQAHIDSTVPAAAVAIANPAAGAAVWIVDKVFNPLGNVSRYRYHVTGTWENPQYADLTKEYRQELDGPAKVDEAR